MTVNTEARERWTNPEAFVDVCEALEDVFALINEGWLVRNIRSDDEENWPLKQFKFVRRLANAGEALKRARGESP